MSDKVPVAVSAIDAALAEWRPSIRSAEAIEVGRVLDWLLAYFGKPKGWDAVKRDYFAALSTIPVDLLHKLREAARDTLDQGWMPKVAQLRGLVAEELGQRHAVVRRLEMARDAALRQQRDIAPDKSGDISPEAQRILARLKEAAAARRMPGSAA